MKYVYDLMCLSLILGEIVISQVRGVLKFLAYTDWKQGLTGWLICTNYKVSFITTQGHFGEVRTAGLVFSQILTTDTP